MFVFLAMNRLLSILLACALAAGLLYPVSALASFNESYYNYYETNLDGDDALERGELELAMSHFQDALNQLNTISRRFPNENRNIVMDKRQELRDKIHELRGRGVNTQWQSAPPPPQQNVTLPAEWQQELERKQQLLDQERARVTDLQGRLSTLQLRHQQELRDEETRRAKIQALVHHYREAARDERLSGEAKAIELEQANLELKAQLEESSQRLKQANLRNQELSASLEEAQLRIASLEKAQEQLLAEQQQLEQRVRLAATDQGITVLLQENQRLQDDFENLQREFSQLKEQAEVDNQQAFNLKLQVAKLQKQIELTSVENNELSLRLERTQLALASATEQLSTATSEVDMSSAEDEIRILRAELARQKGLHQHRKLMRETLIERLNQMGEGGEEIRQFLDGMVAENLTQQQRQEQMINRLLDQASDGVIVQANQPLNQEIDLVRAKEEMEAIQSLLQIAKENFDNNNFELALHNYDLILQSVPNDVPTLIKRSVVLLRTGRSNDAEASLKKALAQRPEDSYARTMLALALLDQERTERAVEELELAIEFNPNDANAHFYRGLIAHREGDFALAEEQYIEAVTLQPEFADAHFNLAALLSNMSPVDSKRISDHYHTALIHQAPRDLRIEEVIANNS